MIFAFTNYIETSNSTLECFPKQGDRFLLLFLSFEFPPQNITFAVNKQFKYSRRDT